MSETVFPTNPLMPSEPLSALLAARAGHAAHGRPAGGVQKAAKDFESMLLYRMLEEMKRTIPDSGLLETGISKQVQDIFWYYLAQELAGQGGLGLWKQLQHSFAASAPGQAPTEQPR